MFLRPAIEREFPLESAIKAQAKTFVDTWCTTEKGKDFWYRTALSGILRLDEHTRPFGRYLTGTVARHIVVSDELVGSELKTLDVIERDFEEKIKRRMCASVVIVTGPMKCGKKSVAMELAEKIPSSRFIRDDHPVLEKERNYFLNWKIINALQMGDTPIISTDCEAFFKRSKKDLEFCLRSFIYQNLGLHVEIILLVPNEGNNNRPGDLKTLYKDYSYQCVADHLPELTGTAFTQKCSDVANGYFLTKAMVLNADRVFTYPFITCCNYDDVLRNLPIDRINPIRQEIVEPRLAKFEQVRVLVVYSVEGKTGDGHITVSYDTLRSKSFSIRDLDEIRKISENAEGHGVFYEFKPLKSGKP